MDELIQPSTVQNEKCMHKYIMHNVATFAYCKYYYVTELNPTACMHYST